MSKSMSEERDSTEHKDASPPDFSASFSKSGDKIEGSITLPWGFVQKSILPLLGLLSGGIVWAIHQAPIAPTNHSPAQIEQTSTR